VPIRNSHPPHTRARPHKAGLLAGATAAVGLTISSVAVVAWASPSAGNAGAATPSPQQLAEGRQHQHQLELVQQQQQLARQQEIAKQQLQQLVDTQKKNFLNTLAWDQAVAKNVAYENAMAHYLAEQAAARAAAAQAQAHVAAPSGAGFTGSVAATFACIRQAESSGNYSAVNSSSGAGGAYQFMPSTWRGLGGTGLPQDAPPAVQDAMALKAYQEDGWSPWRGDRCV
jgi:hypothetical protein